MRRWTLIVILILVCFLGTQCDPNTFSLYPASLPTTTHAVSVGGNFTHQAGEKFSLTTMRANGAGASDLVYLVQSLPNGDARLVVFDNTLSLVAKYHSPNAGSAHAIVTDDIHLTGRAVFNVVSRTFTADAGTFLLPPNGIIVSNGADFYDLTINNDTMYSMLVYRLYQYTASVDPFNADNTTGSVTFNVMNRKYALEAAESRTISSNRYAFLVLRDLATNEGALVQMSFPFSALNPLPLPGDYRIVPGSVRFAEDSSFIVQTDDGYLRRVYFGGGSDNATEAAAYNDYLIAYGSDNSMYLFNTSGLSLLKSRAWWQYGMH